MIMIMIMIMRSLNDKKMLIYSSNNLSLSIPLAINLESIRQYL